MPRAQYPPKPLANEYERDLHMNKHIFVLSAALLAAALTPTTARAQGVGFYTDECSAMAREYFGVRNARTAMHYNGARVDGTETVAGDIYLEARAAYIACAFPSGSTTMSEFFVDGRDHSDFLRPASSGSEVGGTQTVQVQFSSGSTGTELSGTVAPGGSVRYVLGAKNGQNLYVRVAPRNGRLEYEIFNPDGSLLLELINTNREYRGQLWQSGDHVVEVVNRSGQSIDFNVIFGIN